jgi:uncharacterized repeat protein (TIGR02543 family)
MKKAVLLYAAVMVILAFGFSGCPTTESSEDKTVTVTFDLNGGDGTAPAAKTVTQGSALGALPTAPTWSGYNFGGWFDDQAGTGTEYTADSVISADITLYAKWEAQGPQQVTVTFNLNGGDGTAPAAKTVTQGSPLGALPTAPTRSGHSFGGWFDNQEGTGTAFTANSVINAATILYAKWEVQVTVTFNLNGGDGTAPAVRTLNQGSALGALPTAPTRSGYSFEGWFDNQAGTGTAFAATTVISAATTLYAKWEVAVQVTVTFNLNGGDGTVPASRTLNQGSALGALPTAPSRTDYGFGGWFDNQAGTGTAYTATTVISATTTLYAKWNSTAIQVKKLSGAFALDGEGTDAGWAAAEWQPIAQPASGAATGSQFKVLWDDSTENVGAATATHKGHLYVLFDIIDSTPDLSPSSDYNRDCVEVFLDQTNTDATTMSNTNHYQTRTSGVNAEGGGGNAKSNTAHATATTWDSAVTPTATGYMVEVVLNFDLAAITTLSDSIHGFNVNQSNASGGARIAEILWKLPHAYNNPSTWGTITLVP